MDYYDPLIQAHKKVKGDKINHISEVCCVYFPLPPIDNNTLVTISGYTAVIPYFDPSTIANNPSLVFQNIVPMLKSMTSKIQNLNVSINTMDFMGLMTYQQSMVA